MQTPGISDGGHDSFRMNLKPAGETFGQKRGTSYGGRPESAGIPSRNTATHDTSYNYDYNNRGGNPSSYDRYAVDNNYPQYDKQGSVNVTRPLSTSGYDRR